MSKNNDPAFPTTIDLVVNGNRHIVASLTPSLTKLEYFAGKALQGLLGNSDYSFYFDDAHAEKLAATCFLYAEAMLKESEKRNEQRTK